MRNIAVDDELGTRIDTQNILIYRPTFPRHATCTKILYFVILSAAVHPNSEVKFVGLMSLN